MKLLLDQNISYKLLKYLDDYYPNSSHVERLALSYSSDLEIWQFAKENNYTIVTQDVDFYEFSLTNGIPPKIIWIRSGNSNKNEILELLTSNFNNIKKFIENSEYYCLQLF